MTALDSTPTSSGVANAYHGRIPSFAQVCVMCHGRSGLLLQNGRFFVLSALHRPIPTVIEGISLAPLSFPINHQQSFVIK